MNKNDSHNYSVATVAGGCFWCTEAVFTKLNGVFHVTPGYTGGKIENPSYEQVCAGDTGHAEAIQIKFDSNTISYETLLDVFFHLHDPTQLNRQGNDVGTQYRSAVFYHDETQKQTAETLKEKLNASEFNGNIVTEIVEAGTFYSAEEYHHDYYAKNSYQPYCQVVIDPKINKLMKTYSALVKQ